MHDSVRNYVMDYVDKNRMNVNFFDVLEIGSLDRYLTMRKIVGPCRSYTGVDLVPGPGVDIVADAREWQAEKKYDLCICTSVLEHVERPKQMIDSIGKALRPGGVLLLTTHTPAMHPHSMTGNDDNLPGEYYHNFEDGELDALFDPNTWSGGESVFGSIDYFCTVYRHAL